MSILRWMAVALLAAMALGLAYYGWQIHKAYDRLAGRSAVVRTSQGIVEFSDRGHGPPVLVVHGSGGGFDQGELIADAVLSDRFRVIAPSRFGYLRSDVPAGASFDDQAHAYAELLDHLRIHKVAVVALSHGGPSALLFAVLYPQRVSSLALISCGVAASTSVDQAQANRQGDMLAMIFRHDPLYWGISTLMRTRLMELMGASAQVAAGLSIEQRALVDRLIDDMNPVAPRSAGAAFDNRAKLPNERVAAIRAPTLIFHARDDTLQLFSNAQFAAATIPGARLMPFDRGGHLLLAVEQPAIRAALAPFIVVDAGH